MDGINPTLAFAALFLGLSGHPRDTVESQPDQTLITQPDEAQSRRGQTTLTFGLAFEDETAWRLPWLEWQVWGSSKCPDFADAGAVQDGSPVDLDPEESRHTVLNIVAKPHDVTGCLSDRQP
jgi:hypothetical protein